MTESNLVGVYKINGIKNKNAVKIQQTDTVDLTSGAKLTDDSLQKYLIDEHNSIYGEVFSCNITNKMLLASAKQPVLYIATYSLKPLKSMSLCNMILYFTIDDDIKSEKEFLSKPLNGTFTLELVRDGNSTILDNNIDIFPGQDEMVKTLVEYSKTKQLTEILCNLAIVEEDKIVSKYKTDFDYNEVPIPTVILEEINIEDYY